MTEAQSTNGHTTQTSGPVLPASPELGHGYKAHKRDPSKAGIAMCGANVKAGPPHVKNNWPDVTCRRCLQWHPDPNERPYMKAEAAKKARAKPTAARTKTATKVAGKKKRHAELAKVAGALKETITALKGKTKAKKPKAAIAPAAPPSRLLEQIVRYEQSFLGALNEAAQLAASVERAYAEGDATIAQQEAVRELMAKAAELELAVKELRRVSR